MENSRPEWLGKVQAEAQQLGQVLFGNFKHAIELCMKHVPDELNTECRARVFEAVVQAWIGGAMIPIATYANTSKEIEDMVVQEIRLKFNWIRENERDLQLERLDQISKAREQKTGLILAPKE
jgi:hypothetical protein